MYITFIKLVFKIFPHFLLISSDSLLILILEALEGIANSKFLHVVATCRKHSKPYFCTIESKVIFQLKKFNYNNI